MRRKILILLIFTMIIGFTNFPYVYADDRLLLVGTSDKADLYFDSVTLAITKDNNNSTYYDVWVKVTYKQDIQQLNVYTHQQEVLDYNVWHMIIAVTKDRKMYQIRSTTAYGKSGAVLFTSTKAKPMADAAGGSMVDYLADRITEYISKNHIEPMVAPGRKYIPYNKQEYFDLFENKGYKISKIEEAQGPNVYDAAYSSAATTCSFLDKAFDKDVYFGVFGEDSQHLQGAYAAFYTNYLPSKENLNLFYLTLQVLFPDWEQEQSRNWVDQSLEKMNHSDKFMFIHLHKGNDYITITRQDIKENGGILYKMTISQKDPGVVNPIRPYDETERSISVYEEWKPSLISLNV
ncbi:Hypothetical protein LUCI_2379 [Lucifera butyrica]|uniref:Uncharacterized protein n=1 Tax=Lucifera butyrica TaxID=1351585 RepID=A0A498R831_9FIRM|nr:hypothetical protein [Lucifera butyrica]VBB07135.1 Hypothetical protein LUCI_2379 [Lucifera butyrica]